MARRYNEAVSGISRYFSRAFPWKSGKILDVGCGSGRDLANLLSLGFDAYGIDPSSPLLEEAGRAFPQLIGRLSKGGLPLPPDLKLAFPFDGILCSAVFMHIPIDATNAAVSDIRKLLRYEGRLLVSVPDERPDIGPGSRDSEERLFRPFSLTEIMNTFEGKGFRNIFSDRNEDSLGRPGHFWNTLIFENIQE